MENIIKNSDDYVKILIITWLKIRDLYLDPKNPAAYESQKEKIACLESQMTNLVILKSIQEIDDFLIAISTTKE